MNRLLTLSSARKVLRTLFFVLCYFFFSPAGAQELEAKININHSKIQGTDASVFENLKQTAADYRRKFEELLHAQQDALEKATGLF